MRMMPGLFDRTESKRQLHSTAAAIRGGAIAAALSLGWNASSTAHHGITAQFDTSTTFELSGVVTELEFVNPHAYVYFDVAGGVRRRGAVALRVARRHRFAPFRVERGNVQSGYGNRRTGLSGSSGSADLLPGQRHLCQRRYGGAVRAAHGRSCRRQRERAPGAACRRQPQHRWRLGPAATVAGRSECARRRSRPRPAGSQRHGHGNGCIHTAHRTRLIGRGRVRVGGQSPLSMHGSEHLCRLDVRPARQSHRPGRRPDHAHVRLHGHRQGRPPGCGRASGGHRARPGRIFDRALGGR